MLSWGFRLRVLLDGMLRLRLLLDCMLRLWLWFWVLLRRWFGSRLGGSGLGSTTLRRRGWRGFLPLRLREEGASQEHGQWYQNSANKRECAAGFHDVSAFSSNFTLGAFLAGKMARKRSSRVTDGWAERKRSPFGRNDGWGERGVGQFRHLSSGPDCSFVDRQCATRVLSFMCLQPVWRDLTKS